MDLAQSSQTANWIAAVGCGERTFHVRIANRKEAGGILSTDHAGRVFRAALPGWSRSPGLLNLLRASLMWVDRRHILTLGEGDFSFTLHLLQSLPPGSNTQVTSTSFDTRQEIQEKFGLHGVRILDKVQSLGGRILHRINATRLDSYPELSDRLYDEVIFHHPHCGVENARRHRILLAHIFHSVSGLLSVPSGIVTISLAEGQAERWAVVTQAAISSLVLLQVRPLTASFNWRRHQGRSFQHVHRGKNEILQSSMSFTFGLPTRSSEEIQWNAAAIPSVLELPPSFSCDFCQKRYKTAQGLRTHRRDAHSSATAHVSSRAAVGCDPCRRSFVDDPALKLHQLAKHGRDPVIKPDWYNPDPVLPNEFILSCIVCHESFASTDMFQMHIKELEPCPVISWPCSACGKTFGSKHSLRQHSLHCNRHD